MNSILDQYNNKLAEIYQQFVSKNDDITSMLEQDDVDAFINYLSNQKVDVKQYENCYDQGLLHMAAQYDSIDILKYLLQQNPNVLKEDAMNYNPYDIAYEKKSIRVLFYLLSICPNRGEVLFHMMNRFSLFSLENQSYDSFMVLGKDTGNTKERKQFQTNLQSFNTQYRNIQQFKTNSRICLFINNKDAYAVHPNLHLSSLSSLSSHYSFLSCALGKNHAILLTTTGQVLEWSTTGLIKNQTQYLDNSLHFQNAPKFVLSDVCEITCGSNHSIALTNDKQVFVWGQNEAGQIPDSSLSFVETPMKLPYHNYSCVVTNDAILYWPFYRDNQLVSRPTRVNTLCYLHLDITQACCHDGFTTLLTRQGQLFGFYYYIDKNKGLSPSARLLFPSSIQPGSIYALLPSCTVTKVYGVDDGCFVKTIQGHFYYLGVSKKYQFLQQQKDGRVFQLGGSVEIDGVGSSNQVYCHINNYKSMTQPSSSSSLYQLTSQYILQQCSLSSLPQLLSLPISTCSSFFHSLFQFLLPNIVVLTLYHDDLLPKLCSLACSIYQKPSSSVKDIMCTEGYVSLVMKRMKVLRKRLEKVNGLLSEDRYDKYLMSDLIMIEKRHKWMREFEVYVECSKEMMEKVKKECDGETLKRIEWIVSQTIPTKTNNTETLKKKKKKSKSQSATKEVQTKQEKQQTEQVQKTQQNQQPKKKDKKDDGFTVVTKGAVIRNAISIQKIASPSLFEDSEPEEEMPFPIQIDDEDVAEWNMLSQEEIRNQKILLEYYKQQQQKKERRKLENQQKSKKRKGKKSFVC